MKHFTNNVIRVAFLFLGLASMVSCDNDNPAPKPVIEKQHFLYINNLDKSSFLGTFRDLSVKATDNKNATEFQFGIYPFVYKNMIFIADGNFGDKITKFVRNADGSITQAGVLTFEQGAMPGEISFADANTAYISLKGRGKIAIFNPTDLSRKGEIDLSKYAISDNNPDPGCNVLRDGKLFVALNQLNSPHTSVPGTEAQVAVIDIATKKVEKVIKDERTRVVGLFRHSKVIKDEKGDIYFYSQGVEGMKPLKDGFLRIKKGSTEWDKEYYFKLSDNTINIEGKGQLSVSWILSSLYTQNGIAYSSICVPALGTAGVSHSITDKNYQPIKIDLWNKTIKKVNLPLTTSMGAFAMTRQGSDIVFGLVTEAGSGYYTYNIKTQTCSQAPAVTTVGNPSDVIFFE